MFLIPSLNRRKRELRGIMVKRLIRDKRLKKIVCLKNNNLLYWRRRRRLLKCIKSDDVKDDFRWKRSIRRGQFESGLRLWNKLYIAPFTLYLISLLSRRNSICILSCFHHGDFINWLFSNSHLEAMIKKKKVFHPFAVDFSCRLRHLTFWYRCFPLNRASATQHNSIDHRERGMRDLHKLIRAKTGE